MSDENLYLEATKEVEGENRRPDLWAKAVALSEGDKEKAKYKYINIRVEQLASKAQERRSGLAEEPLDPFLIDYIPIQQFSRLKKIPEEKIVKMIRDGFYIGRLKNEQWYVSREEIERNENLDNKSYSAGLTYIDGDEYFPVEEFAELKKIKKETLIEMIRDGSYQGRIIDNNWYVSSAELDTEESGIDPKDLGFRWWNIYAWLGLTIGNISMLWLLSFNVGLFTFLIVLYSLLNVMALKYNKYAFLILTILSLNIIIWIINGVYLKNRWGHPRVNSNL